MVKFVVEFWWKMLLTIFPSKRSSKISFQLRRKFATNFTENFANFTLVIAGAYSLGEGNRESKIASRHWGENFCRETSRCLAGPSGKRCHPEDLYVCHWPSACGRELLLRSGQDLKILRGTTRTYAIETRAVTDN